MATAIQIVVNGLAGPRCTLEASSEWTMLQVGSAISEKIGVPVNWQTLLKDTEQLAWEATVGTLISDDSLSLELTLLVHEAPDLEPDALLVALQRRDEAAVLRLLQRPQVPGLNDVDQDGRTALHWAIHWELPEAARAIVAKPSFSELNSKNDWGSTALHLAASRGFLPVCQALLGRSEFTELLAVSHNGRTALHAARNQGQLAVAEFLQAAENQEPAPKGTEMKQRVELLR